MDQPTFDAHVTDLLAACGGDKDLALRHALSYLADLDDGDDEGYLADLVASVKE